MAALKRKTLIYALWAGLALAIPSLALALNAVLFQRPLTAAVESRLKLLLAP